MTWRKVFPLALLGLAAAAPARNTLLGYRLSGSRHIDAAAILARLPHHAGDMVTAADIAADEARVEAALTARHVHFSEVTTLTLQAQSGQRGVWVIWDIQHFDAISKLPRRGPFVLADESFSGNVRLSAAQLAAASGIKPGDHLGEGSVAEARTGIEQAYDGIYPAGGVKLTGKVKSRPDNTIEILWTISEPVSTTPKPN